MHPQASEYVARAVRLHLGALDGLTVLDIGSYNVNGTVRGHLRGASVFGIDVRPGPDVDCVIDAADFDGDELYDAVVCAETLEHAPDPQAVIGCAYRALKPGGVLIVTAAAPERHPHNVDGDHDAFADGEHYGGIGAADLADWLGGWDVFNIEHDPAFGDVRATARKPT